MGSTASSQTVSLRFIFASQEMPKYFGTKYNDDAQITLDGKNIAVLPNGQELTINNIGCAGSIDAACKTDSSKYIKEYKQNVPAAPGTPASMSGYLSVLTASGSVAAGEHTLEIHVEDIGDGRFNSAIFVEGNSVNIASRRSLRQEAREVLRSRLPTPVLSSLCLLASVDSLCSLRLLPPHGWLPMLVPRRPCVLSSRFVPAMPWVSRLNEKPLGTASNARGKSIMQIDALCRMSLCRMFNKV